MFIYLLSYKTYTYRAINTKYGAGVVVGAGPPLPAGALSVVALGTGLLRGPRRTRAAALAVSPAGAVDTLAFCTLEQVHKVYLHISKVTLTICIFYDWYTQKDSLSDEVMISLVQRINITYFNK